jgi:hypothetical protein
LIFAVGRSFSLHLFYQAGSHYVVLLVDDQVHQRRPLRKYSYFLHIDLYCFFSFISVLRSFTQLSRVCYLVAFKDTEKKSYSLTNDYDLLLK